MAKDLRSDPTFRVARGRQTPSSHAVRQRLFGLVGLVEGSSSWYRSRSRWNSEVVDLFAASEFPSLRAFFVGYTFLRN